MTIKDMGFGLDTGFIVHLLLTILFNTVYLFGTLSNSHSLSLLHRVCRLSVVHYTCADSTLSVVLPVLWYRLPTADVPLPGFQNCPHHTATAALDSCH
jgi:hypothetical protein